MTLDTAPPPPGGTKQAPDAPPMQDFTPDGQLARAAYQDGLTILAEILPGREEALRQTLESVGRHIETNELVPFPRLKTIHFARWFVIGEGRDPFGRVTGPASLVFSSNFDEPRERHLAELCEVAAQGLDAIYGNCRGYPPEGQRTPERVLRYLENHQVGYNTLYVGARGRTVRQIQEEARLRDEIQAFLDTASRDPAFRNLDPGAIRTRIREFVRGRTDLRWALESPPRGRRIWPRWRDLGAVMPLAVLIIVAIVVGVQTSAVSGLIFFAAAVLAIVLAIGLALATIRMKEKRDVVHPPASNFDHVATLVENEDRFVQNPMSVVNVVKPGWFRRLTLRTVLRAIDLAARYVATKGDLGGIPSIHFARWVVIEDGRRVLFMSNYDGSWESYLGDFIDKAATGLTAVWSNTFGFPRSRFLLWDGATDEQRFKAYARNTQVPTQVWYSAYKWLSVQNINNNSATRAGLIGHQTPEQSSAWLQRL